MARERETRAHQYQRTGNCLKTWMNNITPTKIKMLKRRLERDGVTGRVNADTIISMLRNGIQRLEIPTDPHDKEHRRSDVPTSDTSGRPNLKPPSQASAGQSTEKRGNTADAAGERSIRFTGSDHGGLIDTLPKCAAPACPVSRWRLRPARDRPEKSVCLGKSPRGPGDMRLTTATA